MSRSASRKSPLSDADSFGSDSVRSEEHYRQLFNAIPDALFLLSRASGRIIDANHSATQLYGYSRNELLTMKNTDLSAEPEETRRLMAKDAVERLKLIPLRYHRKKDGTVFPTEITSQLMTLNNTELVLACVRDITERRQIEEKVVESEKKWRTLFDILPVGVSLIDGSRITEFNRRLGTILEITREGLEKGTYRQRKYLRSDSSPMPPEEFPSAIAMREQRVVRNIEIGVVKEDGNIIWTRVSAAPLSFPDAACVIVTSDITERKLSEDKIKSLLEEKEALLTEVHHRIKNNMNTLISLLNLQSRRQKESSAISVLQDVKRRILSMGVLYEKLYQTENIHTMSVNDYLDSLLSEIVQQFSDGTLVRIEKKIDDFWLDIERMYPLGILINELTTNSMKYAFQGMEEGTIAISVTLEGDRISFVFQDNGIGIPESIDFENSTGFGLTLVKKMAQQLQGSIRIERGTGARFVLEFNL